MNEIILLNDGTELNGYALADGEWLFVYLHDIDIGTAFRLFYDPAKTRRIRTDRYGEKAEFTGYTELDSIGRGSMQSINLAMKKAVE